MIIKSLGRKASATMTGGGRSSGRGSLRSPFMKLVRYMNRTDGDEKSQSVLWHGFYGHEGMTEEEVVAAFEDNAKLLKDRKNGNVLYHEILSFSSGYRLEGQELARAVADIGQEYLRLRGANQMAYGAIHWDTDHIHLHLMVSANEIGKSARVRLSKAEFAEVQKAVEGYTLAHYPELGQTRIYDRERSKERLKTQVHEQAMKSRTGTPSRKESLKSRLHSVFERAQSADDLSQLLRAENVELYTRGKSTGVIVREADGAERRHRLSSLGIMEHYQVTQERLLKARHSRSADQPDRQSDHSRQPQEQESVMLKSGETRFDGPGGAVWDVPPDTAPEIMAEELVTGKLHPDWHDQPSQSEPDRLNETPKEPLRHYSDDVLKKLQERDAGRSDRSVPAAPSPSEPASKTPDRGQGDDRER